MSAKKQSRKKKSFMPPFPHMYKNLCTDPRLTRTSATSSSRSPRSCASRLPPAISFLALVGLPWGTRSTTAGECACVNPSPPPPPPPLPLPLLARTALAETLLAAESERPVPRSKVEWLNAFIERAAVAEGERGSTVPSAPPPAPARPAAAAAAISAAEPVKGIDGGVDGTLFALEGVDGWW